MVNLTDDFQTEIGVETHIAKPRLFASAEARAITLIIGAIFAWLCIATIFTLIYPDTSTASLDAGLSYLGYAARNGLSFIFLFGCFALLRFTHKSGDVPIVKAVSTHYAAHKSAYFKAPLRFGLGLITFAPFIYAYSTLKTRIPEVVPYSWDVAFYKMDKALFFGRDPWTLFAWIYDMPAVLRVMDFVYDAWAMIMVGTWTLCFLMIKYSAKVRFQFPLALLLTWFIGGNILAMLLSSAGPVYYGAVTGLADPYAAQMAQLSAAGGADSLRALIYQDILWGVYESPSLGLGGISAMPSMHCATSFLLVLLAWSRPVLRYVALAFFTFILISSFVLAWHYAVDGLLAIPIALTCWWLAKKILTRITHTRISPNRLSKVSHV